MERSDDSDGHGMAGRNPGDDLRAREFALKERELDLRAAEIERQRHAGQADRWRSPIVVAVLAAAVAAAGNAIVTVVGGQQDRTLAAQQAENERILEMIKTGDPDLAATNLGFLLDAGLVETSERVVNLRRFLREREPGTGPALAAAQPFSGISGSDDAVPVAELGSKDLASAARSLGLLRSGNQGMCTAFVIDETRVMSASFCIAGPEPMTFSLDVDQTRGVKHEYRVTLPRDADGGSEWEAVTLDVPEGIPSDVVPVEIAKEPPRKGSPAGILYYRHGRPPLLAVWGGEDCIFTEVNDEQLHYNCDTGPGTSGAPVFDLESGAVVGVHMQRSQNGSGGIARRVDYSSSK